MRTTDEGELDVRETWEEARGARLEGEERFFAAAERAWGASLG